jgi:hypothetical protein
VLVPVHLSGDKSDQPTAQTPEIVKGIYQVPERERDVMDDLVDQLAALDSKSSREL